ncbi:CDP-alcohol phosphatidyltransferase family protein [Candidatus Bipolaricaulota bacterium]|nr:CDP-alcohol phosphatidyltransferase family protein [Candidatus Bipolaricaulota bacterium]
MTLANCLTFLRFAATGPAVYFTVRGALPLGFGFFLLGFTTDLLDGYLARTRREVTPVGKVLDPAADKLLFLGVFASFAVLGRISWEALVGYLVPQLGLGIGAAYLYLKRREIRSAEIPGKAAAGATALAAIALYWSPWGESFFWAAVGANFLSGVYYLLKLLRANGGAREGETR